VLAKVRHLIDSSAITKLAHPTVADVLIPLIDAGTAATCGVIDLSLLANMHEPADLSLVATIRAAAFQWLPTEDQDFRRALAVQALLAETGKQLPPWPELVVAAVAERHGVAVLHCSSGYDVIGKVTGQEMRWAAEGH